ncbi:MAG: sulfatase [Solirubrobacterales bacterium]|nr:sulfatase [Solirubrobacterales bacterium]
MARRSLALLICGVVAAAVVGLIAAPVQARQPSSTDSRPNILLVMTDDMAASDLSKMPNVNRLLVKQGTSFTQAITSFPLCCPSRASLLTGMYAHNHGVSGNFAPSGYYGLTHRDNTLPVWLEKAGYHTALIGKYLNGIGSRNPREIPPGYSEWHGVLDLSAYDYFNYTINENGKLKTWGDPVYAYALLEMARVVESQEIHNIFDFIKVIGRLFKPGNFGTKLARNYTNDVTAAITDSVLKGQAKAAKPFFVWWAPAAPHREDLNSQRGATWADPRPAPRDEASMSKYVMPKTPSFNQADVSASPKLMREIPLLNDAGIARLERNYQGRIASLQSVDDGVAKLVATLKRSGQMSNTVIIFVSDNGWVQGEHRIPGDKFVPYEESIKVPLVISGAGIPSGRKVDNQVAANVDLTPTLLELANGKAGRLADGLSLLPYIEGTSQEPNRMLPVEATGKLFVAEGFPQAWDQAYSGVRSRQWKYVKWSYGDIELYDLRKDPYEINNLALKPAYAATVKSLESKRRALAVCKGKSCTTMRG